MKFGYTLLYVSDVPATLAFYEKAFGLERAFLHESNGYGELKTGETRLGFVSLEVAGGNGVRFQTVSPAGDPPGIEVGFTTNDVAGHFQRAVAAGASPVLAPVQKPWGQIVSYVRDNNGFLVEICSAMG
ncbi:MAG TPA: VOC family protein [Myxococcota bacterium]|nr:VOC family protein [Myxococcota bacterium]